MEAGKRGKVGKTIGLYDMVLCAVAVAVALALALALAMAMAGTTMTYSGKVR